MTISEKFEHQGVSYYKFGRSPFGRPTMFSIIYFVDGLLIDTGHRKMKAEIFDAIKHLKVEKIFITHHHEDHTGNITLLQRHFKCPVYASKLCCALMKQPPAISFAQKMLWGQRPPYTDLKPISEVLQTKEHTFNIMPIPGHAADMVALYEPDKKWLFSADLYINSYIGYFLANENIAQQMASLKLALALDFNTLFCGHNPQLQGGKAKLQEKLRFLKTFYDRVAEQHHSGLSPKQIFKTLRLKENVFVKLLSNGQLSKMNMVRSVVRSEKEKHPNLE